MWVISAAFEMGSMGGFVRESTLRAGHRDGGDGGDARDARARANRARARSAVPESSFGRRSGCRWASRAAA